MADSSQDSPSVILRVLYTINSSPQYILARSHAKVPVSIVEHNYATTSLKACLTTVTRSSPELLQDNTRDFSVYVLDPLESLAPLASISSTPADDPRGVAVSLGLMSWTLSSDDNDPSTVTGTLTKVGATQQLEIVLLLREVRKPSVANTVDSNRAIPSAPKNAGPNPRSKAVPRTSASTNNVARSKSSSGRSVPAVPLSPISYAVTSPCVYLRTPPKKGRPSGNGARKSSGKEPEGHLGKGKQVATDKENGRLHSTGGSSSTPTSDNNARRPATAYRNPAAPTSSVDQGGQPEAALASLQHLLDAMSGGVSPKTNRVLLSAIESIDAKDESATERIENKGTGARGTSALTQALKDLLTVAAVTKPGGTEAAQTLAPKQRSDDEIVLLDKANVDPADFRRRTEEKEKAQHRSSSHVKTTSKENVAVTTGSGRVRKRTLSQVMEEREREKERIQKRPHHENAIRCVFPHPSSPPLPPPRPMWPRAPPPSASSPPRPPRYIVPDWAKTTTALQPRFAVREKEGDQPSQPEEKNNKKKQTKERQKGGKKAARESKKTSQTSEPKLSGAKSVVEPKGPKHPTGLKAASSLPVIASQASIPSLSSPIRDAPKTPPLRGGNLSLFTPMPGEGAVTPSPANSRGKLNSIFASTRKAPPMSPTVAVLSRRTTGSLDAKEGGSGGRPDKSSQALEPPFEQSARPSHSLPVASSDFGPPDIFSSDETQITTSSLLSRPHWSLDLPPSSPPPSSPALTPQSDAVEDDDKRSGVTPEPSASDNPFSLSTQESQLLDFSSSEFTQFSDPVSSYGDLSVFFSDTFPPASCDSDSFGLLDICETQTQVDHGVSGLDFSEFWESVKPLVDSDAFLRTGGDGGVDESEIDHLKLGEELQALFGGCVV